MKVLRPRSFSMDYTPKQWVSVCNTILLLIVTVICGVVIYEVYNLDQRFIKIIDSSIYNYDLHGMTGINSYRLTFWRNATSTISLYSAFHRKMSSEEDIIMIIGSTPSSDIRFKDLRCLIKFDEDKDTTVTYVQHQKIKNCTSLLLYCVLTDSEVPSEVAVVSYTSNIPIRWIKIEHIPLKTEATSGSSTIAACVRPLRRHISAKQIADFVAFYQVVGVSHFYFYDHNLSRDVVDFIRQLVATGSSISIFTWNKEGEHSIDCPIAFSEYVQDCLHRAKNRYSYILTVDAIDFFVPVRYYQLPALLDGPRKGNVRLRRANFCNLSRRGNSSEEGDSVRNMVFRGEYYVSNTNFFLSPESVSAIDNYEATQITDQSASFGVFSEHDGVVRHLTRKCDANTNLDTNVAKYSNLLDESPVIEAYRNTFQRKLQLSST